VFYLDTSAFLKLLVAEDHSVALASFASGVDLWSSTLLGVEAHRAALRLEIDVEAVDVMLEAVSLVAPGDATFVAARRVGPPSLRTLDALHLAAALELGEDLEGLVAYDKRLAAGADLAGLLVVSPGQPPGWWSS
jgi:uncharacterized protein